VKLYMTAGTFDFMKTMENKHPSESMITMQNADGALLLHESAGKSVFKEPRSYEVIDSAGTMKKSGFIVMNNIPVTDEGRPLFEYRFKNRARMIENEPGFIAIRVLRPLSSNTYVILTQWDSEKDFTRWQESESFGKAHEKKGPKQGVASQPQIFASPSYVTKYTIPSE
jgi:heme oxygenase (mycobilin-producing)